MDESTLVKIIAPFNKDICINRQPEVVQSMYAPIGIRKQFFGCIYDYHRLE